MQISIIQGVALSLLVSNSMTLVAIPPFSLSQRLMYLSLALTSLVALITISFLYSYFINLTQHLRTSPSLSDSALPIILGIAQVIPTYYLDNPKAWWATFAFLLFFSLLPLGRTRNLLGESDSRIQPDHHRKSIVETHANMGIASFNGIVAIAASYLSKPNGDCKSAAANWCDHLSWLVLVWAGFAVLLIKSSKYVVEVADKSRCA